MVLEDWSTMYEPASNSKVFESSFEPVYVTYTGAAVGKPSPLSSEYGRARENGQTASYAAWEWGKVEFG